VTSPPSMVPKRVPVTSPPGLFELPTGSGPEGVSDLRLGSWGCFSGWAFAPCSAFFPVLWCIADLAASALIFCPVQATTHRLRLAAGLAGRGGELVSALRSGVGVRGRCRRGGGVRGRAPCPVPFLPSRCDCFSILAGCGEEEVSAFRGASGRAPCPACFSSRRER